MTVDVLLHAALARLGPVTVEWARLSGADRAKGFKVTVGTPGPMPGSYWSVESPSWDELWERFILEAVARR